MTWTTQALTLNNGKPVPGQSVSWQMGSGMGASSANPVITDATGIAAKALTVGPLSEGQQATATACLNGTTQCVTYKALGARAEFASLQPVAGTAQNLNHHRDPRGRWLCGFWTWVAIPWRGVWSRCINRSTPGLRRVRHGGVAYNRSCWRARPR